MADGILNEVLPAIAERRTSRRRLLTKAAVAAGVAVGTGLVGGSRRQVAEGATLAQKYGPKGARIKVKDADILNFALNLEYLEAEYYQRAANGLALGTGDISGLIGTQGTVTGGAQINFDDAVLQQFAQEIAADELAHVRFLRSTLGLKELVTRPSIDFTDGFALLGQLASLPAAVLNANNVFDPFSNELTFLLGAFFLEDLGVTAYQGAAPYIGNSTYLQKAAGILAVEGYHAAEVRTELYRIGVQSTANAALLDAANSIASTRQTLSQRGDSVFPTDEGLSASGPTPNLVPANSNGLTYPRSFSAVLNIVYLNNYDTIAQSGAGGFFPNGFNGRIH